jgi:hypothetical protein
MVRLCVVLLSVSILWIFGTFPWLLVNSLLCSKASKTCPNPDQFGQQALLILIIDALALSVGIYAAFQLRAIGRSKQ